MKFSSLNENVKSVSLENQIGIVDKLFSSIAMDRVANFFKTKL